MMQEINYRKIIPRVISGVMLIVLISWLVHFLRSGTIIITTDDPDNTITLSQISDGGKITSAKNFATHTKLVANVSVGKYLAAVEGNSVATKQVVKLGSHKTIKIKINPINTTGVEPVAYLGGQSIAASDSQLYYLDVISHRLRKIDLQNNLTTADPSPELQNIKWADSSFGVGQQADGHLYSINNGVLSPLKVPFSYDSAVNFAVTPNKQIYVSHGAEVYSGTSDNFKKIYTAGSAKPIIEATQNKLVVADQSISISESKYVVAVVDSSGKAIRRQLSAGKLAWSPDGKHLIITDESGMEVFDDTLRLAAQIPNDDFIGQVVWLNNNRFFYSTADTLWVYDLNGDKAQILANMPLGESVSGLSLSDDKSNLYISTTDDSGNSALRRIGLRGQQVPGFLFQLQSILPKSLDYCSLGLINFKSVPVILVTPFTAIGATNQGCINQARDELAQDGFDLNKLQFRISP